MYKKIGKVDGLLTDKPEGLIFGRRSKIPENETHFSDAFFITSFLFSSAVKMTFCKFERRNKYKRKRQEFNLNRENLFGVLAGGLAVPGFIVFSNLFDFISKGPVSDDMLKRPSK